MCTLPFSSLLGFLVFVIEGCSTRGTRAVRFVRVFLYLLLYEKLLGWALFAEDFFGFLKIKKSIFLADSKSD